MDAERWLLLLMHVCLPDESIYKSQYIYLGCTFQFEMVFYALYSIALLRKLVFHLYHFIGISPYVIMSVFLQEWELYFGTAVFILPVFVLLFSALFY